MATTRPFAYNTGSTISGTAQIGNIAIGADIMDYSVNPGGVKWWMGPDEELGYVIGCPVPSMNHPTPVGIGAGIEFWRSNGLTEGEFLKTANVVAIRKGQLPFSGSTDAVTWLNNSGYFSVYPYESESVSLFNRMTVQPSNQLKDIINNGISDLKINNLWNKADVVVFPMLHTAQASSLNWRKNQHNLTAVNGPVFNAYRGWNINAHFSHVLAINYNTLTAENITTKNGTLAQWVYNDGTSGGNMLNSNSGTYAYDSISSLNYNLTGSVIAQSAGGRTQGYLTVLLKQNGLSVYYAARDGNVYGVGQGTADIKNAGYIGSFNSVYSSSSTVVNPRAGYYGAYLTSTEWETLKPIMNNIISQIYALG